MGNTILLNRDTLVASLTDYKPTPMDVPEWGGVILIEHAKADKIAEFLEVLRKDENTPDLEVTMYLIMKFIVDEKGGLFFKPADREWLMHQPLPVLMRISNRIAEVNGFSAKSAKEAEENFG